MLCIHETLNKDLFYELEVQNSPLKISFLWRILLKIQSLSVRQRVSRQIYMSRTTQDADYNQAKQLVLILIFVLRTKALKYSSLKDEWSVDMLCLYQSALWLEFRLLKRVKSNFVLQSLICLLLCFFCLSVFKAKKHCWSGEAIKEYSQCSRLCKCTFATVLHTTEA